MSVILVFPMGCYPLSAQYVASLENKHVAGRWDRGLRRVINPEMHTMSGRDYFPGTPCDMQWSGPWTYPTYKASLCLGLWWAGR